MDEKELLKKAFEYGNVPSLITYCFTEPCPMKDKCIHYLSGLYKNEETDRGSAIFPNALKNGKCEYTGIHSPPSGHPQNKCWATSAHKAGNEYPNFGACFGQR